MSEKRQPKEKGCGDLLAELESQENKAQITILQRFFKTAPGEYGAGDVFMGLKVPFIRSAARKYRHLPLSAVSKLLKDKRHEVRLCGLLILVDKYEYSRKETEKEKIVDFYLRHTKYINNWDLVDLSVYKILGDFLSGLDKKKARVFLEKLLQSKNMWERRMAMVATYAFLKKGRAEETLFAAKKLLADKNDLIHKAIGWMLREMGKRVDDSQLRDFLDQNIRKISRTTLRYAIEHFSEDERKKYLLK
ncbi:MAG: DNA alkylation repair protein [Patescibacteria group bacterium]